MDNLIPKQSWSLCFEELEGVTFYLKEFTDSDFLEASEIGASIFDASSKPFERDKAKLALVDFCLLNVEGMEKEEVNFSLKLNIAIQVIKYMNPDALKVKK